jgi:hypothetical protein
MLEMIDGLQRVKELTGHQRVVVGWLLNLGIRPQEMRHGAIRKHLREAIAPEQRDVQQLQHVALLLKPLEPVREGDAA